jgi:hypothetical protein
MAKKIDDIRDLRVNTKQLSEMFLLTPARVGQLVQLGVLERDGDGLFALQLSLISYERFLRSGPPQPARW